LRRVQELQIQETAGKALCFKPAVFIKLFLCYDQLATAKLSSATWLTSARPLSVNT
jgi:hypothetical protein